MALKVMPPVAVMVPPVPFSKVPSTETSNAVTAAVAVTVWPLRTCTNILLALVGGEAGVDGEGNAGLTSASQVEVVFQSPEVTER